MIEVLSGQKSGQALVTLAIGEEFFLKWEKNALPNWLRYCQSHGIGLYIQEESIDEKIPRKKPQWQKILLPKVLKEKYGYINEYCYLDTDIAVNQYAESVFDLNKPGKLSLVSQFNNLPYDLHEVLKRIAFYRNKYYSSEYPLDSSLFMSIEQIYEFHTLPPQTDYACTGMFMGYALEHADKLERIYDKYDYSIETLTDGGDEPILNYEFQTNFDINWLPYKFQAIWIYEMAFKYPFLYQKQKNEELVNNCIENSVASNTFLHFAGSWYESDMFHNLHSINFSTNLIEEFQRYKKTQVSGNPVGIIKPKKI